MKKAILCLDHHNQNLIYLYSITSSVIEIFDFFDIDYLNNFYEINSSVSFQDVDKWKTLLG